MFGDLIKKLLGKDQPGIQRQGMRDASELPKGMNFNPQPMNMQGFGSTNPSLPQGMKFGKSLMRPQLEVESSFGTGMESENSLNPQEVFGQPNIQGSLSDYYRLRY